MPTKIFDCDVCGSDAAAEITCLRRYSDDHPIHVCKNCGFVYVRERRSFEEIAAAWANEIYTTGGNTRGDNVYTAAIPAVQARLTFILQTLDQQVGIEGKMLCDIGAGEGYFLQFIKKEIENVSIFGIEPSTPNCTLMNEQDIPCFDGTIEEYIASDDAKLGQFDVVTIMWTLEDCQDCTVMLEAANKLLKPGGHIIIGTGSRILVPFKKPLHYYVGPGDQDTHCFRFTANSLSNLFRKTGFEPIYKNRFIDNDILCMIAAKKESIDRTRLEKDDYLQVIEFFNRWDDETQKFYSDT